MRGISFKRAASGGGTAPSPPLVLARRSTAIAETYSRLGGQTVNLSALASGTLQVVGIPLLAGQVVTSITFFSGGTAAGTPTNQWFALYSPARALLAVTSDDTTNPWPASTGKTLPLSSPYTVPEDGIYLLGVMVKATTVPWLIGYSANDVVAGLSPTLSGRHWITSSLTTPSTAPATLTLNTQQPIFWAYVS